jgi:hypothetical protein
MLRGLTTIIFTLALLLGQPAHAATQSADALRNRVNQGTVAIITGGVNGTYIRIASDLAAVLDKSDQLRILPIVGKGSVQNIADLLGQAASRKRARQSNDRCGSTGAGTDANRFCFAPAHRHEGTRTGLIPRFPPIPPWSTEPPLSKCC